MTAFEDWAEAHVAAPGWVEAHVAAPGGGWVESYIAVVVVAPTGCSVA